ncbi:MAG: FAD-dependent oxidoreductase [Sterolibacteriaceae bacterium]|uniref:FAD-dependent oxidoreductase n=1 Tax=Candidatus Methylophosphatis roskildensis TaxID=2899263 RepID=A0A9D7E7Q1_9PROT|nr:FAD-dependent oxidoreductase [Candidatus Methylophosphatis roskildensis]
MRIAVIGSGISGLAAAWLLTSRHSVTLYEAADYLGGHTNTVDVQLDGKRQPVDTGFLVFNRRTYPNLTALFELLEVPIAQSEMSFAVSLAEPSIEWSGSSLATVFAQRANLARPAFWRMLQDIIRFNREVVANAEDAAAMSLGEYLDRNRYSAEFRHWYLLPMAAAIWSCPTQTMLDYPLSTFVRFCRNHGLLQLFDRPQWLTVRGGGREYVRKLAAKIADVRLSTPVERISRADEAVRIETRHGVERYDHVVFASHSDQTLAMLGRDASAEERTLLGAIRYQPNRAVLHTDRALLPRVQSTWSAWNYLAGKGAADQRPVSVSYLINRLQPLPFAQPVVVSLNPFIEPDEAKVIAEFDYAHPVFDQAAIDAQARMPRLQGQRNTWFCGAWLGYGFHEDGLRSAVDVANRLGVAAPWLGKRQASARELEVA